MGLVTSLGCRVEDVWTRVCNGHNGVRSLQRFDAAAYRVRFGGEILDSEWSTEGYIDHREAKRLDRFTQFAMVAGIDAVRDSGIDFSKEEPFRCGVMVGSGRPDSSNGLFSCTVSSSRFLLEQQRPRFTYEVQTDPIFSRCSEFFIDCIGYRKIPIV